MIASDYIKNFPFEILRERQSSVLEQIATAFASGYKHIILEAPTGFGKSPVGIATALTQGSSYILTSTKNLQTQYARDFPFVRVAKGKNNFRCEVKDDFIKNGTFKCKSCGGSGGIDNDNGNGNGNGLQAGYCRHASVEYGPCMSDDEFECGYKTKLKDYHVIDRGTKEERVLLLEEDYRNAYSEWLHLDNISKDKKRDWRPCEYFHELNIATAASYSVLNYAIFLGLMNKRLPPRDLLILDEAHTLESEIVKFCELSISLWKWRKYIPDLKLDNHGYDVKKWVGFLDKLRDMMLDVKDDVVEADAMNTTTKANPRKNAEYLIDIRKGIEKLEFTIDSISLNPDNWIVSEIKIEEGVVVRVTLRPLDVSPYCRPVLGLCSKSLMMSATILDPDTFCRGVGLKPEEVKIIRVGSDFPLENRPIYPANVAYLNHNELKKDEVKIRIASAIDKIMTHHRDHKGIIHTTSYEQLNFIKQNISKINQYRLLETNPDVERDEVIDAHFESSKPTVLISPSLHLGLDLMGDLSRFQVITKVPWPSLSDRWIDEKRRRSEEWYRWQTALKLVQAYGRSVRSKDDWAITYVLDSAFGGFMSKNSGLLPKWFTDAIEDWR